MAELADTKSMKAIYHQIDPQTVRNALSLFLAGAAGLSPKEIPKRLCERDFVDSLIHHKVDITGEFGLAKLAAMNKSLLLHLFIEEMGLGREDATINACQVLALAGEQLTRFVRTPES